MDLRFANDGLRRLAEEEGHDAGYTAGLVTKYPMRVQLIRAAEDERAFYALKSLHFEKLKGKRSHQRSMKLNDQFRLILEIEKGSPKNTVVIVSIEDYH